MLATAAAAAAAASSHSSQFLQITTKHILLLQINSTIAEASSSYLTTQTSVSTHQGAPLKLVPSLLLGPLRSTIFTVYPVFFTAKTPCKANRFTKFQHGSEEERWQEEAKGC